MAETFGCCSSYVECSNQGRCIKDGPDYTGCQYKKNLLAGIVYYGVNKRKEIVKIEMPEKAPAKVLYLCGNKRMLAILKRSSNVGYSYKLSEDEIDQLEEFLSGAGVRVTTDIDEDKCIIDKPSDADPSRANSRVVISAGGVDYNILNFNLWMIKGSTAKRVSEYFQKIGIASRVEKFGADIFTSVPDIPAIAKVEQKVPKLPVPAKVITPTQSNVIIAMKKQIEGQMTLF